MPQESHAFEIGGLVHDRSLPHQHGQRDADAGESDAREVCWHVKHERDVGAYILVGPCSAYLPRDITERPSGVAASMSSHSKTPCIILSMDLVKG